MHVRTGSSKEIVGTYLSFFREHGHVELPSSPLAVPGSSTSFVIAGMQPLLPYLTGREQPPAKRLMSLQRCLRTDDIDAVGTNGRKLTCFHMLGNWSIGDYGKREIINMAWNLLFQRLGLEQERCVVTVFAGDAEEGILPDEVAIEEWMKLGFPRERIVPLGMEDNLWTMGGPGPCGPCTEIFVDRGQEFSCGKETCRPGCECERFLEVGNLVFMEYEWRENGSFGPLPLRNVDVGMGLERLATALQDVPSAYETDMFVLAGERLAQLAKPGCVGNKELERKARRIILDHTRAALFAGLGGVRPDRDGRGSVVRRLIRRAARQGRMLGLSDAFLSELIEPLVEGHRGLLDDEELMKLPAIIRMIRDEEQRFEKVLTQGLKLLTKLEPDEQGVVPGEHVFRLHAEKGFPSDLAIEILEERGLRVDLTGYVSAMEAHRQVSRVSVERRFHA